MNSPIQSRLRPGWVYFAYAPMLHRCKIGWTENTPQKRLASATDSPDVINVWGMLYGFKDLEKTLHDHFRYLRVKGEWFAVDDHLRMFVQYHTCRDASDINSTKWSDDAWSKFDILSSCGHWESLVGLCQSNPVQICERYKSAGEYFYLCVKPFVESWYGWGATWRTGEHAEFLKSSEAYDLAYEMCYDLLPC